jgi:hypothetical protein
VRLNKEKFVAENEVMLLQPVSFILMIKRNLSAALCRPIPDVEMSGRLKHINLLMNHEDYAMIITTLSENLGETIDDGVSVHQVSRTDKKNVQINRTSTCKCKHFSSLKRIIIHEDI